MIIEHQRASGRDRETQEVVGRVWSGSVFPDLVKQKHRASGDASERRLASFDSGSLS